MRKNIWKTGYEEIDWHYKKQRNYCKNLTGKNERDLFNQLTWSKTIADIKIFWFVGPNSDSKNVITWKYFPMGEQQSNYKAKKNWWFNIQRIFIPLTEHLKVNKRISDFIEITIGRRSHYKTLLKPQMPQQRMKKF